MVQKQGTVAKTVSQGRAEEMVMAGSAPSASYAGDPIAHVHRGTGFVVLVDAGIVVYLTYTTLGALGFFPSSAAANGFLVAALLLAYSVYAGYRSRRSWAYWPAVGVLFAASLMFAFLAFLNLLQSLMSGEFILLVFTFLMGWAALGSGRRAVFHWHPVYRSGYHNTNPLTTFDLQDGEMLAACPSCLAVLAIRPAMLGQADKCPHCGNGLVSKELLARHGGEEE